MGNLFTADENKELYEVEKKRSIDHAGTPRFIVEDIFKKIHIENYKNIWFPFDNDDSYFKIVADEMKLNYKHTHIFDSEGNDFFITVPPNDCDPLISNPPFGLQNDIIKRCFELIEDKQIKHWVLLLPQSTLETRTRANLYERYLDDLKMIAFKDRIRFDGYNKQFDRACCWICINIDDLPPFSYIRGQIKYFE